MSHERTIVLNEHSIKRHSKRLLEEMKPYKPEMTLGEAQNMFARCLGLNTWHEVKKILDAGTLPLLGNPQDTIIQLAITHNEIYCYSDEPVFYKDKNDSIVYSDLVLLEKEVIDFLNVMLGKDAFSNMACYGELNFTYHTQGETFLINANMASKNGKRQICLKITKLSKKSLPLSSLVMNNSIIPYMKKTEGLTIITGKIGTGKTTLLNTVLNDIGQNRNKLILTYENPIEYHYDDVVNVSQSEVPKHFKCYPDAIRSALRRHPTHILIGELKDVDTFNDLSIAAATGHAVYTSDYSASITKALLRYREMSKDMVTFKGFLDSMNILVHQKIVKSDINGKIIFLQNFLAFNPSVVQGVLRAIDAPDVHTSVQAMIEANNGSTRQQIKQLLKEKVISPALAKKLLTSEE